MNNELLKEYKDKLPEYLIYRHITKGGSEIKVRKVNNYKEIGIQVSERVYDFPFSQAAETFLNRKDAELLIKAIQGYFKL